jgi:hypothetical protein
MSCASYAAGNLSAFLLNDLSRLATLGKCQRPIGLMSWPNDPDSVIINGVIMNSGARSGHFLSYQASMDLPSIGP